ncbi:MAG: uroporphyrinogen-III C-methyltransferase [Sphingomonadales bacterium]|nr:uroporphyrinogen-III C-methyltransferase [Sphingomonadales bacterium]
MPLGLARWAAAAKAWRPRVTERFAGYRDRRAFWRRFVGRAWAHIDRLPEKADLDALIAGADAAPRRGSVTLVGAGPGDPELLTLKAFRALQSATVILYDDLVTPEVLELARREARRIAVGKRARGPSCDQQDIDAMLVRLASEGETVVRLKGGDPLIFGRASEEIEDCRAAGIEVSLIPGISAAQGAAAALGFSLTERVVARRLQFVTGAGPGGRLPDDIDWRAIADPGATTVIYMPRRTLADFAAAAIQAGLDPATPALAIAAATRPDQRDIRAMIAALPTCMASLPPEAPVLVVVGEVTREAVETAARHQQAA